MTVTPRSNRYHVRLPKHSEMSEGGIYLPDHWQENWVQGTVLARGPGLTVPLGEDDQTLAPMWAAVGDEVLFEKHDLNLFDAPDRIGSVADDRLVGLIRKGDLHPLNDWVQVEQDPDPAPTSVIVTPDEYRPKATSGMVLDWGPGRLRMTGPLYGTRKLVNEIMGLDAMALNWHTRVYWDGIVDTLAVGRSRLEYVFIRADDIYAYEEIR